MTEHQLKDVIETDMLRSIYGDTIILLDEQDESVAHRIVKEFTIGDQSYAILQSEELRKEEEVAIFRISKSAEDEWELETIEDDDEWENISELYDEMMFDPEK